ncbi:hypothetical protein FD724_07295 [Nostoc sp. C057]|uniref:hypothetical protein n=1 Tax=Nostoc sp. C057 TaxID=2576903 RepID=UPI0015C2E52C|nr:hypothetical protein [Nostoc sp. C057]QLE47940.1 hypothetical protein FD724_07295 [Nostoc sp. C057]
MSSILYADTGLLEENGATTTTQSYRRSAINSQKPRQINQARHSNTADLIVTEESPRGIILQHVLPSRPTKRYWRVLEQPGLASKQANNYVLRFAASEEQFRQNDTGVTTSSIAITSLDNDEDLEDELRLHRDDSFSVAHKPEVLFSKQVELRTSDLPRWKPHITIDRRMIEAEDD